MGQVPDEGTWPERTAAAVSGQRRANPLESADADKERQHRTSNRARSLRRVQKRIHGHRRIERIGSRLCRRTGRSQHAEHDQDSAFRTHLKALMPTKSRSTAAPMAATGVAWSATLAVIAVTS